MTDLDKIAGQVAEVAQRVADVLDAGTREGFRRTCAGGSMSRSGATTIFACEKTATSTPISSTAQNAVGDVARRLPSDG